MILQVFLEAGRMRGQALKGCEKEEEPNKESSERQRLASLFLFHLPIIKGTKVDFLLLFLRKLPYLSGIEQFYIDTNPCNKMATPLGNEYIVCSFVFVYFINT